MQKKYNDKNDSFRFILTLALCASVITGCSSSASADPPAPISHNSSDQDEVIALIPEYDDSLDPFINEENVDSQLLEDTEPMQEEIPVPEDPPVPVQEEITSTDAMDLYVPEGVDGRPSMDDFAWYPSEVQLKEFDSDVPGIHDPGELTGYWKAYIKLDPDNENDMRADLLLNVDISIGQYNTDMTFVWYSIHYLKDPDSFYDDSEPSHFYGSFEDQENGVELIVEGPGKVHMRRFYYYQNRQYGVGRIDTANGTVGILCLVRP